MNNKRYADDKGIDVKEARGEVDDIVGFGPEQSPSNVKAAKYEVGSKLYAALRANIKRRKQSKSDCKK